MSNSGVVSHTMSASSATTSDLLLSSTIFRTPSHSTISESFRLSTSSTVSMSTSLSPPSVTSSTVTATAPSPSQWMCNVSGGTVLVRLTPPVASTSDGGPVAFVVSAPGDVTERDTNSIPRATLTTSGLGIAMNVSIATPGNIADHWVVGGVTMSGDALNWTVQSSNTVSTQVTSAVASVSSGSALGRMMATRSMVLCNADSVVGGGVLDLKLEICGVLGEPSVVARSAIVSNLEFVQGVACGVGRKKRF
ncbi:leucine-rich repeat protein, putative [Bodo saltans]|uniref:Leucine-rich repeat protein, putative n=1 Tax=Bodo saltans TaxID=75058 RepID=A0A0S4J7T0_BODSA|nr:leucine-rich repeat protein, putative [Bodo saltans]|eukprot:CUG87557.1 leucine-rich repeat protein, putative [Bodo saltans]